MRSELPTPLILAILLAGCGGPPADRLEAADAAAKKATDAGAALFAPTCLDSAMALLAEGKERIGAEDRKLPPLRRYTSARDVLDKAIATFGAAESTAAVSKAAMRGPVRALIRDTNAAVDAAEQALAKRMLAGTGQSLTAERTELAALRTALATAAAAERTGNLPAAKAELDSTLDRAHALAERLR